MSVVGVRRGGATLVPRSDRVILRPFVPSGVRHVEAIISRALRLDDARASIELAAVTAGFGGRHRDLERRLLAVYDTVAARVPNPRSLSRDRKMLIGAFFTGEYSLESAALFNPSIVAAPDQAGAPEGGLRVVMSLRATGEGHVSSIEFRSGTVLAGGDVELDPASRYVSTPDIDPDPIYDTAAFAAMLRDMGCDDEFSRDLLGRLGARFARSEFTRCALSARHERKPAPKGLSETLARMQWLADSNYDIRFPADLPLNERAIFPVSANESNGIEDARFVRFVEDDGDVTYYATYTAYNGHAILPQMIETRDFLSFRVLTLNGEAVRNKGLALFPRRIGGRYAMLSRQDDENLFIMFSSHPHHWNETSLLMRPAEPWESVKIGNCGSPVETSEGWLVITHGVGPMRRYCMGAALLDLDDPRKVIGRLRYPLVEPDEEGRDGYVPNVVYSCGALAHGGRLVLPYAMSDRTTTVASVALDELLRALTRPGT